jgi:hypothetical protein
MTQATHEAARAVVDFALKEPTLMAGDPRGLLAKDDRQAAEPGRPQL